MKRFKRRSPGFSLPVFWLALFVNCISTSYGTELNGTSTPGGDPMAFQSTERIAIHLFFGSTPLWGDASIAGAADAFTSEAVERGASRTLITDMDKTSYWFVLPPFSFILTPVESETSGYIYR